MLIFYSRKPNGKIAGKEVRINNFIIKFKKFCPNLKKSHISGKTLRGGVFK